MVADLGKRRINSEGSLKKAIYIPLSSYREYSQEEMCKRAIEFRKDMQRRRSVRHFSNRPVPGEIIKNCLIAAGSAPSGANLQPWFFVVVSDPEIKRQIRNAAEKEEAKFYQNKAPQEWVGALSSLGTDEHKPFLENAPYLIVIFAQRYRLLPEGQIGKNYYVSESIGIATGMLITAIHNAGLVSLTHTPSPMNFLNKILNRPVNEKPFLILVAGYPAQNVVVPEIAKKSLKDYTTFI